MVEIIAGTFGFYDGRRVVPITHEDGAQSFAPELEARLVKEGIARFVAHPSMQADEYEQMKLEQLKEVAQQYGVDASEMRRKSDIIQAIQSATDHSLQQTDEMFPFPVLQAQPPVE